VSDFNGDGLSDAFDEPHEFGLDLDGGSDMVSDGFDAGDAGDVGGVLGGVDLITLEWLDAADLLGADLVSGLDDVLHDGDPDGPGGGGTAPFPEDDAFYAALESAPAPEALAGWVAGLRIRNPFHVPRDAREQDAPEPPQDAPAEG
jgi:hypothetical protein